MLIDNIFTERLVIRNMTKEDAIEVFNIWSNPNNTKFMSDPPSNIEEILDIFEKERKSYLVVALLKDEIIGTSSFGSMRKSPSTFGMGYSIKHEHWNKGFATEIVKGIINHSKSLGAKEFLIDFAKENTASQRVLEKCGLTFSHEDSFSQPDGTIYESLVYKIII